MCLAIPARIERIDNGVATCRVGEGETFVQASLMLLPEPAEVGDYLIIHAGFAIRKLDLQEAQESLTILRELAEAYEREQARYAQPTA
ncbi:MAG: hydrogenase assembly chaperone hypC/hupF [Desulfomicrobiaceae bacterium]|jgi:hydrogenase expression/formation protein HypC|nr:HypC/HybG/HupF family hydrogenase formation chaperone [Desulfomicrobiaceae bacterium]MBZ4648468.1 hydrogenase assembly chaperone hypC/hupF [Desulfomicrobiaceae bacterium]MBZ4685383.1 hydrogenase assembly chaperone hypC/hupF [Desulfomicrobiaceae bacterium]HCF05244.1 HypC/HybG/HupF family hydrogenase formation chaperone [Desulfomicrobiaceae bacterium]